MLAMMRSAGVCTRDESEGIHCMQLTNQTSKGSTVALKSMADITRSPKQGYQGIVSSNSENIIILIFFPEIIM